MRIWDRLGIGGGGVFAAWMALARCSVRDPWPVPASRISSRDRSRCAVGLVACEDAGAGGGWISRSETMRLASAA